MSESTDTPKSPPRRRLVPEAGQSIEVGGQRLAKVARVIDEDPEPASDPSPPPPPPPTVEIRSLDDVAKKHLGDVDAFSLIENNADLLRKLAAEAEEDESPMRGVAERMELFTEGKVVLPPLEHDPKKREGIAVSPIVGTADSSADLSFDTSNPETLFDLFSAFPLLDGVNWWIYVERKLPRIFSGTNVAGVCVPIKRPLSIMDWDAIYGGGTYKLIVYGPPKNGAVMDSEGRVPAKRMTEAITVVFPGAPNPSSMDFDYHASLQEEDPMTNPMLSNIPARTQRVATVAEASVENKKIDVEASKEIRQELREKEAREKADQVQREKQMSEQGLLKLFLDQQNKAAEREAELREQQIAREREYAKEKLEMLERFESKMKEVVGEKKPDDFDRVMGAVKTFAKPDNSEAHAREIERLQSLRQEDARRADDRVKEERERADRRIKDAEERAAERIKEVESRISATERDIRDRAEAEVRRTKEECDRRTQDLHQRGLDLMAQETRNHDRDMKGLAAQFQIQLDAQKNNYEMQLSIAKGDVKRSQSDAERFRAEAEAGKDVVGQITKLKDQAAALGMVDASEAGSDTPEPETWQQMVLKVGAGLVGNLPGMVENIVSLAKRPNPAELEAAREAERQRMIHQAGSFGPGQPPPHQLGSGGRERRIQEPLRHMSEVQPTPRRAGAEPFQVPPTAPAPAPMQPIASVMPPPPPPAEVAVYSAPAPQPAPSVAPPPPPAPTASIPPPPQAAPPPPATALAPPQDAAAAQAEDIQLLSAANLLLPQYQAQVPTEVVASEMVKQWGAEMIGSLVANVNTERIVLALERQGVTGSPFLRRDGKKYLRQLFTDLKRVLSGG
jgi:hypothetical protein